MNHPLSPEPSRQPPPCQLPARQSRLIRRAGVVAGGWCLGSLLLGSCQSSNPPPAKPIDRALVSQHWVKVAAKPPTFYPRGVSPDCPTDYQSGEWIHTGDDAGTRYFIPLKGPTGVPRQDLVNEAMAMRSERKLGQLAAEDREARSRFLKKSPILIPLNLLTGMGGGSPSGESELEEMTGRWQREWESSKKGKPNRDR